MPNTDWSSFQGYFDTFMGQFQQNLQQSLTNTMGQFQHHVLDSMREYRQEHIAHMMQNEQCIDVSFQAIHEEIGAVRHDVRGIYTRMDTHEEGMTALEKSWNAWTITSTAYPMPLRQSYHSSPSPPPEQ
ncbi:hypothetical protein C2S51_020326 [Perilla frutescens var. frutescens]|nr:hypothetical protein C2S51_020326 [Perilla frutescens var. frutescens]